MKLGFANTLWLGSAAAVALARRLHPRAAITAGSGAPVGSVLITLVSRQWAWSGAALTDALVARLLLVASAVQHTAIVSHFLHS